MNYSDKNFPFSHSDPLNESPWSFSRPWYLNPEDLEIVDNINLQLTKQREVDSQNRAHANTHPTYSSRSKRLIHKTQHQLTQNRPTALIDTETTNDDCYTRDIYDIFVEDLHSKSKILRLTSSTITVRSLLDKISDVYYIPPKELRVTLGGREISNFMSMTLKEIGVTNNDTIRLKLRLRGGHPQQEGIPSSTSKFLTNSPERLNLNSSLIEDSKHSLDKTNDLLEPHLNFGPMVPSKHNKTKFWRKSTSFDPPLSTAATPFIRPCWRKNSDSLYFYNQIDKYPRSIAPV